MRVVTSGPIKPLTPIELAFASAKLYHPDKLQPNPEACNNGTGHSGEAQHKAIYKSAQRLRSQLIKEVEQYTGKPIAQFAEEVRAWHRSNYKIPFPSTAYAK